MRRILISLLAFGLVAGLAAEGSAQQQGPNSKRASKESADAQREKNRTRKRLDKEMQSQQLPLPELGNSGPCPFVKVLYDAARTIEFVGGRQSSSAVAYSGEIQGLTATCRYQDGEPITVDINVTFTLGKGPQATENAKQFDYWVAVTDRNRSVLAKEQFSFVADLSKSDRVIAFQPIKAITIPRANDRVSGQNFEILVGFNVTPEMAAFNRQGTRFVVNATGQQGAAQDQ